MYHWQLQDWPKFTYSIGTAAPLLYEFAEATAHLNGIAKALPERTLWNAIITTLLREAMKTSAIEGEYLSREDVMSSIRNKMGYAETLPPIKDKRAQGVGELMVLVRKTYTKPLTDKLLFEWHKLLLKGDKSDILKGAWRVSKEPMQVVSGAIGKFKVHYEAPPAARVPAEMKKFIAWFNATAPGGRMAMAEAPIRAALVHLYFESIHPFQDGNGRIGRALAEKALSQTLGRPALLSLSHVMEANRKAYYQALKKAQSALEVSAWIHYFLKVVVQAQRDSIALFDYTVQQSKFYDKHKKKFNARQKKAIQKMMDAGPEGFDGGMNARKYSSINKTSKATATRDLQALTEMGVLLPQGGGRSTSYQLNLE